MDDDTQKKIGSLLEIVRTMIKNIIDEIPSFLLGSGQQAQIKATLSALSAPEAIKMMARTTIPSISWSHAKILAVHGKTMMTGGVNFWHDYGDNQHHINDVSVTLRGDAAISAHTYCNYFWKYVCHASLLGGADQAVGTSTEIMSLTLSRSVAPCVSVIVGSQYGPRR